MNRRDFTWVESGVGLGGAEAVPGGKIWKDLEVRQGAEGKCEAWQCRASDPRGSWRKQERKLEAQRTALLISCYEKMYVHMDMCGANAGCKLERDQNGWRLYKGKHVYQAAHQKKLWPGDKRRGPFFRVRTSFLCLAQCLSRP